MNQTQKRRLMEKAGAMFHEFQKGKRIYLTSKEAAKLVSFEQKVQDARKKLNEAKKDLNKNFPGVYFVVIRGNHSDGYLHNLTDNVEGTKNYCRQETPTSEQLEIARAAYSEFEDKLIFGSAVDYMNIIEEFRNTLAKIGEKK